MERDEVAKGTPASGLFAGAVPAGHASVPVPTNVIDFRWFFIAKLGQFDLIADIYDIYGLKDAILYSRFW